MSDEVAMPAFCLTVSAWLLVCFGFFPLISAAAAEENWKISAQQTRVI